MTSEDLKKEIDIELELIESIVQEIISLRNDLSQREPITREKTATAAFMAQFYNGSENILKRISYFYAIPLPTGDTWHIELFKNFCFPSHKSLPVLFDQTLNLKIAPYRKFRYVVFHGYGTQLEWHRMKEGIENLEDTYRLFKYNLLNYIDALRNE